MLNRSTLALYLLLFILFISNIIFVSGIADQAQYGPQICLLFLSNYHYDTNFNAFLFNAGSSACGASIAIGLISLFAGLVITAAVTYYTLKQLEIPSRGYFMFALLSGFLALLMLIMSSIVAAGIRQTCREMEANASSSCSGIFNTGFFSNDPKTYYSKNLTTVNAAMGAGWVSMLSWILFGVFSYFQSKSTSWW
jgi:hypothetical protein